MGILSDAMQKLVNDINVSAESRHTAVKDLIADTKRFITDTHNKHLAQADATRNQLAWSRQKLSSDEKARGESAQRYINNLKVKISEMNSDTHNLLERFHLEHRDMARALRRRLSSDEKALKESTQQFMNNARSEHQDMARALRRRLSSDEKALKESTQQFMNNARSEHQDMAKALRQRLSSDKKALMEATRHLMDEFASDHHGALEIWTRMKVVKEVAPPPVVGKPVVEEAVPQPAAISEYQVLEVIARHPEGIRLVDIGNELGVDWRSLIGVAKSIVDEGRIEKIDSLYYPKSRDWERREE